MCKKKAKKKKERKRVEPLNVSGRTLEGGREWRRDAGATASRRHLINVDVVGRRLQVAAFELPSFFVFFRCVLQPKRTGGHIVSGFTGFLRWILLGFSTGLPTVFHGTGFNWPFIGFFLVLNSSEWGFDGFYWVSLGFTWFYWVLLGF